MQCCPSNGLVAYGGEDGEVAIFKERMLLDNRVRRAHTAVAGQFDACKAKQHGLCPYLHGQIVCLAPYRLSQLSKFVHE